MWKQTKPVRRCRFEDCTVLVRGGEICLCLSRLPGHCLNALLREHEKLVDFVIGRQRIGQTEWVEFQSQ